MHTFPGFVLNTEYLTSIIRTPAGKDSIASKVEDKLNRHE